MCFLRSELVSTFSSEPTCMVVSLDGDLIVVSTEQGMLHFINTQTGQVWTHFSSRNVPICVLHCVTFSSCHTFCGLIDWLGGLYSRFLASVVDVPALVFSSRSVHLNAHKESGRSENPTTRLHALHKMSVININTSPGCAQEVKSLVSSCDGISSCVFVKDGRLATTSFDGRIEIWDIGNGCRWEEGSKEHLQNTSDCTNPLILLDFEGFFQI